MEAVKRDSFVHGLSRQMRMASTISMVIADAKGQKAIQLRDLIAAIYVANFDRVLRFWPDAATFEDFIAEHCDWTECRFTTWNRWTYNELHPPRTISIPFTGRFFQIRRKYTIAGKLFTHSDELNRVYATAEALSPNKVPALRSDVSFITPELFLLATVRTDGVDLGTKMAKSGLRVELLEGIAIKQLDAEVLRNLR